MLGCWTLKHSTWFLLPILILGLALLWNPSSPLARSLPSLAKLSKHSKHLFRSASSQSPTMPKAPVYFFSHGGVNTSRRAAGDFPTTADSSAAAQCSI